MSPWLLQRINEVTSGKRKDSQIPISITINPTDYYQYISDYQKDMASAGVVVTKQTGSTIEVKTPISQLIKLGTFNAFTKFEASTGAGSFLVPIVGEIPGTGAQAPKPETKLGITSGFLQQTQWGLPVWSWLAIASGLTVIFIGLRLRKKTS
ncbi:MAG: hypothetical protein ACHQII_08525 [Bacteroidia bacterium]